MPELERLSPDAFQNSVKHPVVVVLDQVRSMNNVGSVFRTADAFRIESICLCGYTPRPPHRDIQKTALGATETVHWQGFETTLEAIQLYRSKGYRILGIEQTHQSILLDEILWTPAEPLVLIFGNEVQGIEDAVLAQCDAVIEIPQAGSKHSLNVTISAGILLWDVFRAYGRPGH